jgi:hypothetical protein
MHKLFLLKCKTPLTDTIYKIMETQLLKEQHLFPTKEILENALGDSYPIYEEFLKTIISNAFGLVTEWNYYKDGKAWLCKVCYKKKTILWLSVWNKYFKTSFFFTEKNKVGIANLDMEEKIKENFFHSNPKGKMIPLVINISQKEQMKDVLKIIAFKKSLK